MLCSIVLHRAFRIAAVVSVVTAACAPSPIEWGDPYSLPAPLARAARLAFDSTKGLVAVAVSHTPPPAPANQCPASARVARDAQGDSYAVWWALRSDSTADLVVSRSEDGAVWSTPIRVDSVDIARVGCRRPAPSIDAHGGHVHVAYAMAAREGPGIFATHSMDRGNMFHTPVAVVYGERLGETAIAARGDVVVIAYEDPNSPLDHIGVAVSRTMAHLFQSRQTITPSAGAARRPGIVLADDRIAVTWTRSDSAATRMAREGVLR